MIELIKLANLYLNIILRNMGITRLLILQNINIKKRTIAILAGIVSLALVVTSTVAWVLQQDITKLNQFTWTGELDQKITVELKEDYSTVLINFFGEKDFVKINVPGTYNVYNAAGAALALSCLGIDKKIIFVNPRNKTCFEESL